MSFINPIDTDNVIAIGEACVFLSSDEISKKSIFGNPYPVPLISEDISICTDILDNAYDGTNGNNPNVNNLANFLLSLCGKWIGAAQRLLGNMQGIIIVPTDIVGTYLTTQRFYPQFRIGDNGSPMSAGDTVLTILDDDIVPESANGLVWAHVDGGLEPENINDGSVADFTALYSTGRFDITFYNPAVNGQIYKIKYPVKTNLSISTAVVVDTAYTGTTVNVQTVTLLNTSGNIFLPVINTQGILNIKLFARDTSDNSKRLVANYNYEISNVNNTVDIQLSDGGIWFQSLGIEMTNNIVISADNTLHGVKIEVTGVNTETIFYRAIFSYTPSDL